MNSLPYAKSMNLKFSVLLLAYIFITSAVVAQEITKKQEKAEQRKALQAAIEALVTSKTFNFYPSTASAQGFRPVGISSEHNYVKFRSDSIASKLPFFGQTYGSIAFGGDNGLAFLGAADDFIVTVKKNNIRISVLVKSEVNVYRLILTVRFSGNATLSVSSNNRSPVTYEGWISGEEIPLEKP